MDMQQAVKEIIEGREEARDRAYDAERKRAILWEGLREIRDMARKMAGHNAFLVVAESYLAKAKGH